MTPEYKVGSLKSEGPDANLVLEKLGLRTDFGWSIGCLNLAEYGRPLQEMTVVTVEPAFSLDSNDSTPHCFVATYDGTNRTTCTPNGGSHNGRLLMAKGHGNSWETISRVAPDEVGANLSLICPGEEDSGRFRLIADVSLGTVNDPGFRCVRGWDNGVWRWLKHGYSLESDETLVMFPRPDQKEVRIIPLSVLLGYDGILE